MQRARGQDAACRYGGEEFAVILSGASIAVAQKRAELLREDPKLLTVEYSGQVLGGVTLSIGVAAFPDQDTSEGLIWATSGHYRAWGKWLR